MGALSAILLAAACGRTEIGAEQARPYFAAHRTELESVVEQVELCQPESGKIDQRTDFHCRSLEGNAQALRAAMAAADAKWIRAHYNERQGEELTLTSVHIAMPSSYGFVAAGVIEAFIYETTPAIEAAYERRDNGTAIVERQPVTETPHHWYWRKIER